jgi:hypothetical protein
MTGLNGDPRAKRLVIVNKHTVVADFAVCRMETCRGRRRPKHSLNFAGIRAGLELADARLSPLNYHPVGGTFEFADNGRSDRGISI